jgi:hypothetical protein
VLESPQLPDTHSDWPEAIATVLECRYDMRAGRAIAFGLPSDKHFRIRYNYFANGEHHEGQFYSRTAMPQNTLFPIHYNPNEPLNHLHAYSSVTVPTPRSTRLIIGIIGSLILSIAWFAVLRGCH